MSKKYFKIPLFLDQLVWKNISVFILLSNVLSYNLYHSKTVITFYLAWEFITVVMKNP